MRLPLFRIAAVLGKHNVVGEQIADGVIPDERGHMARPVEDDEYDEVGGGG